MGSVFEVLFPTDLRSFVDAAHRALDEVRRLEKLMTVYSEDSEISKVNHWAFMEPVAVSRDVMDVLVLSKKISEDTHGAFDITSGALTKIWGFLSRQGSVPPENQIVETIQRIGSTKMQLDPYACTVSFINEGTELNLGSIGKGFALDRAGLILQNEGLDAGLIHAGFSSFKAIGSPVRSTRGWKIGIKHPLEKDKDILTLRLQDQAISTSGIEEQSFEEDGRRFGHILDPRTGYPSNHYLSVTAIAPTAGIADALSTAFFVMTMEEIRSYCNEHRNIGAIIVPKPNEGQELETVFIGSVGDCLDR
jgi:thiamine biosynthesis lipoprotein